MHTIAPAPQPGQPHPAGDLDALAQAIGGTFVAVVSTAAGRYRRRCFLTLASAQRAADRAHASGHAAEVVLCQLTPVQLVPGATEQAGRAA